MRTNARTPGFDGFQSSVTSQTTWTQAVQLRATPSATRLVVAVVVSRNATTHTQSSCTVLGTALTSRIATGAAGPVSLCVYADYIAAGNAGNAVTVVDTACATWGLALFSFERASATPANTYSDVTSAFTASAAYTAGAVVIIGGCGSSGNIARPNFTGLACGRERRPIFTKDINNIISFSVAKIHPRVAETKVITMDHDQGASTERLVVGVWA